MLSWGAAFLQNPKKRIVLTNPFLSFESRIFIETSNLIRLKVADVIYGFFISFEVNIQQIN